ncbi:hypothetical protein [Sporichthya sp.]|uniref:hypothetical protein n=1 Tax=Sporichthya sp. TaxID=65475 RepID=UPI0017989133|nr:hypothetical protein [Sporichthya sp.]MBA3743515.1 hypothetical protein [Sporichthya sp.]
MSSINAAAITAKHKGSAEGSVRVLGQTAAVAGISGALLLALKAMVLVAPAVLPGGDGLDALGRPNAVAAPVVEVPVVFEPASADMPIGASERTAPSITRTVTIPTTTTKPVTTTNPSNPTTSNPSNPSTPSTPADKPASPVGTVTKPVTDLLDGIAPGVGTTVGPVVDTVGGTADGVVDTVTGATGGVLKPVTDTLGVGSGAAAEQGLVAKLGNTVGNVVGGSQGGVLGGSSNGGGLLGGLG